MLHAGTLEDVQCTRNTLQHATIIQTIIHVHYNSSRKEYKFKKQYKSPP